MASSSTASLCGAAVVFVVQDVLRSVEHYRDVLGFHTEFTYGQPTFYAGVGRIALVGSLASDKDDPKDADVLIAVDDYADLTSLATAGRRLKGRAQSQNKGIRP